MWIFSKDLILLETNDTDFTISFDSVEKSSQPELEEFELGIDTVCNLTPLELARTLQIVPMLITAEIASLEKE